MRILYYRLNRDLFSQSLNYNTLKNHGLGGSEFHAFSHTWALKRLGHEVYLFGISNVDSRQDGVYFLNSDVDLIDRFPDPTYFDVIFFIYCKEIFFLSNYYKAKFVEVCQNGPHFEHKKTNIFAFVGDGVHAFYAVKKRSLRHKFFLLPNYSSYNSPFFSDVISEISTLKLVKEKRIIWVGSIAKQGFVKCIEASVQFLNEHRDWSLTICVPGYDVKELESNYVLKEFVGNSINRRIEIGSFNPRELAIRFSTSSIALCSLGGEDGPSSYLDAHFFGLPLISGGDIISFFWNPIGLGLNASTKNEVYNRLTMLANDENLRNTLGNRAKQNVEKLSSYTKQEEQLVYLLSILEDDVDYSYLDIKPRYQNDNKFGSYFLFDRINTKLRYLKRYLHNFNS